MPAKKFLCGRPIAPPPLSRTTSLENIIEDSFLAYNGGRLREAALLLSEKILRDDVTVGLSLTGALTPAGLGQSCIIPLIEAGFVDWISSTGANLYHDLHFSLKLHLRQGTPFVDDAALRRQGVIRIYDICFDYRVLLKTDAALRRIVARPEFRRRMGTAEFHNLLGKHIDQIEAAGGNRQRSILSTAFRYGVPVYTSAPGDSSLWMNVAALDLQGKAPTLDICRDVNETAALVYGAKRGGGESAVWILGGGSPKNFMLQTEPQIQEVLGLDEKGHDYFIQITDARADTGGLSGATPSEAVSWGKIDPRKLPHAVVCYTDVTIALPLLTAYVLKQNAPRRPKRLYDQRDKLLAQLREHYLRKIKKGR